MISNPLPLASGGALLHSSDPHGPAVLLPNHDTAALIGRFQGEGLPSETMARLLNGTQHTAFLDDMRLARKVVSVGQDEYYSRIHVVESQAKRIEAINLIDRARAEKWDLKKILLSLLSVLGTYECRSLLDCLRKKNILLKFVSAPEMSRLSAALTTQNDMCVSYYHRRPGQKPTILVTEFPPNIYELEEHPFRLSVLHRLLGSVHEWDHWRQDGGFYEREEKGSAPVRLSASFWMRREAMVGEIMSMLEEHRLRVVINDHKVRREARARGETVAQACHRVAGEASPPLFGEKWAKVLSELKTLVTSAVRGRRV